jgi:hypothetical protein
MRLVLCLSILMASSAGAADEAADRAAIEKVISTLNSAPGSPGLFTDDFGDGAVLTSLGVYRDSPRDSPRDGPAVTIPVAAPESGQPTIHVSVGEISMCVSHDPMGELGPCGGMDRSGSAPASRFIIQSLRLITPEVALVDAVHNREFAGLSRRSPVLLVLRREGGVWKIASLRVMAPPLRLVAQ